MTEGKRHSAHLPPGSQNVMRCCFLVFQCLITVLANAQQQADAPALLGRLVDIGGRRLHVYCTGTGEPTVLVENGGGAFSIDWALVQPSVSKFTRICTYDRAGYAWSDRGPIRDLPEETIADFQLMLRSADIQPPYILVGQSMGGILVRDYQRRIPESVAGMVLVDPTYEEGNAYIIDGKPKPVALVTRGELDKVIRDLLAQPYIAPRKPIKLSDPYVRLPADLQPLRLWAERQYFADQVPNHAIAPYVSEADREEFVALRGQRLSRKHPLGTLPLIVLTNGSNPQKAELATLSESGAVVVAENSCHEIHLCSPELVIDAIRNVVNAARKNR